MEFRRISGLTLPMPFVVAEEKMLTPPAGAPCEPLDEDGGDLYDADDAELEGANVQRDDLTALAADLEEAKHDAELRWRVALLLRVRRLERYANDTNNALTVIGLRLDALEREAKIAKSQRAQLHALVEGEVRALDQAREVA